MPNKVPLAALVCLTLVLLLVLSFSPSVSGQSLVATRYYGTVKTAAGDNVAVGTSLQAKVSATVCGQTTVISDSGSSVYVVDVFSAEHMPGCGTAEAIVTFVVGGQTAAPASAWGQATQQVNLTVAATVAGFASPGSGAGSASGSSSATGHFQELPSAARPVTFTVWLGSTMAVAEAASTAGDPANFDALWIFGNGTQAHSGYFPKAPAFARGGGFSLKDGQPVIFVKNP